VATAKKRKVRRRLSAEGQQEKLGRIIEQVAAYQPRSVIPFSSWARGNHQVMSDVDLLISRETETPLLGRPGIPTASPMASLMACPQPVKSERRWSSYAW
jgi:predicted nucleotidyltransferase